MDPRIDDRGRLVLPKRVRDRLGLRPGRRVRVEIQGDGVLVRPEADREEALSRLVGAVNRETRDDRAQKMDPMRLKREWEPRL